MLVIPATRDVRPWTFIDWVVSLIRHQLALSLVDDEVSMAIPAITRDSVYKPPIPVQQMAPRLLADNVCAAQIIKNAVTTLLRFDGAGCEVTALLRKPWKPASLLGFG